MPNLTHSPKIGYQMGIKNSKGTVSIENLINQSIDEIRYYSVAKNQYSKGRVQSELTMGSFFFTF